MTPIAKAKERLSHDVRRIHGYRRFMRYRNDPRVATAILAAASALSLIAVLYFGRGTTFSGDESTWVAATPDIDFTTIFTPHGGHLLALTRVVYWPILEFFGLGYLPFRLLSFGAVLLTVWLLYIYGRRRSDHFVALAPCIVLLFFGSDFLHLFQGNGFTVMISMALGIAALLCFERGDRRGDLLACLWLTIGIFAYSTILPFVVAIGVLVLLERNRWSRIWIPLVPAAVYLLWRAWLVTADVGGTGGGFDVQNLLLIPAWSFQSLSGILNSLTGLSYAFTGENITGSIELAGPPLAILLILLIGWKVSRDGLSRAMLAAIVVAVSLFALQAAASSDSSARIPGVDSRYLYPGAVMVILIVYELARSWKPSPRGLIAILLLTVCGLSTNLLLMKDNSAYVRESGYEVRSLSGALDLAIQGRPDIVTSTQTSDSADESSITALVGMAEQDYGDFGYSPDELRGQPVVRRQSIDQVGITALGIELVPFSGTPGRCRTQSAGPDGVSRIKTGSGSVVLHSAGGGVVSLGRFADTAGVAVGTLVPGTPATLTLPDDSARQPWKIAVTSPKLEVCRDA
ncbi:MAG: ArnT family glycosyltransferase [Solirubrobacterales bacterium]